MEQFRANFQFMELMLNYGIPVICVGLLIIGIMSIVSGSNEANMGKIAWGISGSAFSIVIGCWFYFDINPEYWAAKAGFEKSTNKELKIIVTKQAITKFATGILSKSSKIDSVLVNKKGNGFVFTTEGNYYFRVEKKDTSLLVSKFVKTDMTEEERTLLLSESK